MWREVDKHYISQHTLTNSKLFFARAFQCLLVSEWKLSVPLLSAPSSYPTPNKKHTNKFVWTRNETKNLEVQWMVMWT
jgi:hypothetical protein